MTKMGELREFSEKMVVQGQCGNPTQEPESSELTEASVREIAVVDLFCGVGGLTHGFVSEGIRVIAGLDSDASCQYAYEHNNEGAKFVREDIGIVRAEDISSLYPDGAVKVLVGCAPCQPFSPYTKKKEKVEKNWELLGAFADLIEEVNPDVVSMENVPELRTFRDGAVYDEFFERMKQFFDGHVTDYVVHCPDYGIPQNRDRLVLFASRLGDVEIADATHTSETYKTVQTTIGSLAPLEAGQTDSGDPLHRASRLSELNLRRIRQSVPGGTWRDWAQELRAACHVKSSGKTYPSVYGRMRWDEPSPTITTQCHGYGNGRFGHPVQDRAISLREAALLQSFPLDYQFFEPNSEWHISTVGRHIGNAVPVDLGRVIAKSIKRHVEALSVSI
jgi:DNA (cytosine-5)-methyltransferase 1